MLDHAFEALKKFDFGTPLSEVQEIDEAVVSSHKNAARRADLEQRLIAALGGELSRDAKDYVCRKLAIVGTAVSVPALSALLASEANSHLARHALERIPGREAAAALADGATKLTGNLQFGAIGSIGARREGSGVATLTGLLKEADAAIVRAAAMALGAIGGPEAAAALRSAIQTGTGDKTSLVDALLACAESLRNARRSSDALAIYEWLSDERQPRLIRLAATRGMLACGSQVG